MLRKLVYTSGILLIGWTIFVQRACMRRMSSMARIAEIRRPGCGPSPGASGRRSATEAWGRRSRRGRFSGVVAAPAASGAAMPELTEVVLDFSRPATSERCSGCRGAPRRLPALVMAECIENGGVLPAIGRGWPGMLREDVGDAGPRRPPGEFRGQDDRDRPGGGAISWDMARPTSGRRAAQPATRRLIRTCWSGGRWTVGKHSDRQGRAVVGPPAAQLDAVCWQV